MTSSSDPIAQLSLTKSIESLIQDLSRSRRQRRAVPLIPYERFDFDPRSLVPGYLASGFRESIERLLESGYRLGETSIPSLIRPIEWLGHERSFAYHLNAWDPISDLLMGHSLFREERFFAIALDFIIDWIERFQLQSFVIGPDPDELDTAFGPTPWYDMAVGMRVYRLAYVADIMMRDPQYSNDEVVMVVRSLVFHLRLLSREDFFRAHSNHGLYQALGELAASRRFRDEPFFLERFHEATDRVREMIDQQFHGEGMHREHSPGYHYMVLGSLIGARESGLFSQVDLRERISSAEEVLTWLIQPNGLILTFGDTDRRTLGQKDVDTKRYENAQLRFQISGGRIGDRPNPGIRVLKEAGYVFARSEFPEGPDHSWWYLAQMASFHSRVHKHADDLSFIWSDQGCEIFIDPGRFAYSGKTELNSALAKQGFWYSDPKRIYVESTRAHNTVEIDGRSYDRRRVPYGSALKYAGMQDGLIVTECELHHFRTVRHWRVLVLSPGEFLLVVDWLFDRSGMKHDMRQYFHFHPDWNVAHEVSDDQWLGRLSMRHGKSRRQLTILPLVDDQETSRVIRGQEAPELLGWYSDRPHSLVPCTTIEISRLEVDFTVFATLFTLGSNAQTAPNHTSVLRSMRPSRFVWWEGGDRFRIEMQRGKEGTPVTVTLHREGRMQATQV